MRRALPIFISVILVLAIVYFKLRKMENLEWSPIKSKIHSRKKS
jgi:hypothetical protein